MSEITIGVAIIADDRLEQLKQLLPQLEKFDQVVIGWNGSDPEVKKYLDQLCTPQKSPYEYFHFDWRPSARKTKTVYPFGKNGEDPLDQFGSIYDAEYYDINEWGFSYARNLTFERLKTTHAVWIDSDDQIGFMKNGKDYIVSADQAYKAFKKVATEAPEEIDLWFTNYVYSRDMYNNPNVVHARERMMKLSSGWKWVYPIHEVVVPNQEPKWSMITDVQILHYPREKEKSSADRNLEMLADWHDQLSQYGTEYEHDLGRCKTYIGETYWALHEWKLASEWLMRFIKDHPRALDVEKWQAWIFIAKCQLELNNFEAARAAALASIDIEPGLCDGYILLAQVKLLTDQDPQDILILIDAAGRAEEPPPQVIQNPLDYTYTPYCIVSKCKYLLGQYDSALEWALKALNLAPSDPKVEKLRADAAARVRERDTVNASKALYQLYFDYDENEKASRLYEILPYVAQKDETIIEAATTAAKRVRHLHNRDEYIKLYSNNKHWVPVEESWIDAGDIPVEPRMKYTLGRLKQALPDGGRILDVGCADGYHSLLYAKHGFEVVGVDLDKRCVDLANERAEARALPAKFIHGFFEEMSPDNMADPFDSTRNWFHNFDAVLCSEVIEHVQDPQFLLGALVDCAKDGAPVIVTTPDEAFDKGDLVGCGAYDEEHELTGHVRVFTQQTFEALLKSDIEVHVVESHFLGNGNPYRENQGWQVGEIRRVPRPKGPIVRIWCGELAKFAPDDLDSGGIGGSETAVIHMAREWAKLGCQVVVYGNTNGIYDGVFYRHHEQFSPEHRSDIFISWRIPTIFEGSRPNAGITLLWAHDLYYPIKLPGQKRNQFPQEWIDRIDRIVVLSNFHRDYISIVHPNFAPKLWISRNGIDADRYANNKIEKVPNRYFYSSSYDRGLEELLEIWPQIKESIPDAELHVCYGMQIAEMLYKVTGETQKLNKLYRLVAGMNAMDGVFHHDRIGQQELADLQLSCEAWLYPPQPNHENGAGGFLETYCITALEAQAARCVPISRMNGAIPQTLHYKVSWESLDQVIDILGNLDSFKDILDSNQKYALTQTWESLAAEWLNELLPKEE